MVYEIKCSWCGQHMGTKEGKETKFALALKEKGVPVVSHAICSKCKEAIKIKYGLNQGGNENG
ncbi:MAG: hypothetical protein HUN04_04485 [Desulfobacter sp.]|nr:MAG: hypothetical protein HUN04_04485 [Desulfobacter sp.]